ncbi:ribonuclease G [Fangia hongkongensis]|uniref:ribonuclease G n=1 Tax=Fangia hongkongensis TaxID=270495 RepID=UPI000478053D|nr:ribonuclease G [Fangia hongkongensis]MBK2126056.1 ribonuclease G [Fangia hongkongensis]
MSNTTKAEILMNIEPHEKRVAIIENGVLQEVHIERENQRGIVGNIYKGKIIRVLPGMQAAFVDIGLERSGFLHVSDVMPIASDENAGIDLNSKEADVRKWLREGQSILVQVLKDPLGTKGARLSAHLSLASRYLVHMPDLDHIGISLRIESEQERDRLQSVMKEALSQEHPRGFIIRTVAEGLSAEALRKDIIFLQNLWQDVVDSSSTVTKPGVVYQDLSLATRTLRDLANDRVEKIRVDNLDLYSELCRFSDKFVPGVREKLECYHSNVPIFDMYAVEDALAKAIERKVPLKSGGYIIIDQTEAMTTIDVNTGAYVGMVNLEETIFKTNLEAVYVIARQLRLRNLGGIIIIDFIDMSDEEHKELVLEALGKALEQDYARTTFSGLSELGLVEMTRKRTQESLVQFLCEPCSMCQGKGKIKTVQTVCYEIFREIKRESKAYQSSGFIVVASSQVVDALQNDESFGLGELEIIIQKPIKLQAEMSYAQEMYDIVLM